MAQSQSLQRNKVVLFIALMLLVSFIIAAVFGTTRYDELQKVRILPFA